MKFDDEIPDKGNGWAVTHRTPVVYRDVYRMPTHEELDLILESTPPFLECDSELGHSFLLSPVLSGCITACNDDQIVVGYSVRRDGQGGRKAYDKIGFHSFERPVAPAVAERKAQEELEKAELVAKQAVERADLLRRLKLLQK